LAATLEIVAHVQFSSMGARYALASLPSGKHKAVKYARLKV
jgi:hypothetical protein